MLRSLWSPYLVVNNIIYTSKGQVAAIRVDANETTTGIVIRNNLLRGENQRPLIEGIGGKNGQRQLRI